MKPKPEPVDPDQIVELAHAVIESAKFPMLATVDAENQPRVRPVSPVKVERDFTIYVANLRAYKKTEEIAANQRVELAYLDSRHDQVRVTGVAKVEEDEVVLQEIWDANPLLKQYLGTIDNPELIVYRIEPNHVRFMREWSLEYYQVM